MENGLPRKCSRVVGDRGIRQTYFLTHPNRVRYFAMSGLYYLHLFFGSRAIGSNKTVWAMQRSRSVFAKGRRIAKGGSLLGIINVVNLKKRNLEISECSGMAS